MPWKATQLKLQSLQARHSKLSRQASELAEAREMLLHKQHRLQELCACVSLYQVGNAAQGPGDGCSSGTQQLEDLLLQESTLLQQLQLAPAPQQLALVLSDLGMETIAPRSDPLALFKRIVTMPQLPGAKELLLTAFAEIYRACFLEGSIKLHMLQSSTPSVRQQAVQGLEKLWIRVLHMHMSVLMCGRPELIEGLNLINLDTLQEDPDATRCNAARTASMPPLLNLTPQQLQEISAGTALFGSLLSSILCDQQQLQQQLSADAAHDGPTSSSSTSTSSLGSMQQALHSSHKDLESHQRDTGWLQALLHKGYVIRSAFFGWIRGCLSWEQVTKAVMLSWPYCWKCTLCAQGTTCYAQEIANGSSQQEGVTVASRASRNGV